jgi:hypothetical protein
MCPGALFVESVPVLPEHENKCVDVSCPGHTEMHYMIRRSHQMQKLNFVVTCPVAPFLVSWWLEFIKDYDVGINTNDTSTPTHNQISGLITLARARQLNN